ncbi:uncharacterized protein BDZ99DRAFT_531117 [Mytilinidion resinicola]|uniref:Uncharacterized protein n=1 Tax=Mytilinidion resinicola TaxID=574789 RepID=A0A6A6ZAY9_9PEZI|nr:uncharacterized protein BDZ99DRAFT_531117 [Mytilinidion resinicola]KAF2817873.1 hypothetical protein BDZ99DRAFT_531117 [Mytilinidion resinicola]
MTREMQEGVEGVAGWTRFMRVAGWSRFMRIAERPDDFGPADLEHQLRLMTGACEKNPARATGTRRAISGWSSHAESRHGALREVVQDGGLDCLRNARRFRTHDLEQQLCLMTASGRRTQLCGTSTQRAISGRSSLEWWMQRRQRSTSGSCSGLWDRLFAERPDDFGPLYSEHQLCLMTGEWKTNPALRYRHAAGDLWMEFPGVMEAKTAVGHFGKLFRQVGSVVGFAMDPAITDRENAEKWAKEADEENGGVNGYDGDGEETAVQEEAKVAGAEEHPLIEF